MTELKRFLDQSVEIRITEMLHVALIYSVVGMGDIGMQLL